MYSYEEKLKAVELYIKYDLSAAATIRELGYPDRKTLKEWYNACVENFFGCLKCATFRQMEKKGKNLTFEQAKMTVDNYIDWYNNGRRQKKLGYMSPVKYRLFK